MFSKKTMLILFLLLIAISTATSVSANDLADGPVSDTGDNEIGVSEDMQNDENTLSLSNVESEDDSGDEVLSIEDSVDALKAGPKPMIDLQTQINNQFAGATISLTCDYYWDTSFENASGIFIRKPITINGNGHIIDAGGKTRHFLIYSDKVVLNNITFLNGYGEDNGGKGGSICTFNNVTTIKNCNFINNTAEDCGGAITTSGRLNLNNCNFENNHAKSNGGAICAYAPKTETISLNIDGCTFNNNWADSYGGVIYHFYYTNNGLVPMDAVPKTVIKNSEFSNNGAIYGGVIFNSQRTDIYNCNFTGNYASGGGGAIYMAAGILLTDSYGRAAYAEPVSLTIHGKTKFINNYAEYYGGAIRISSSDSYVAAGVKGILRVYDDVVFKDNYGEGPGGALSLVESDALVEHAQFIDNKADYGGSAMYGGIAINCRFRGNDDPETYDTTITNKIQGKITLKQVGSYYKDKKITVTLINRNTKEALAYKKVTVKIGGKSLSGTTNSKGVATINIPCGTGKYTATATSSDSSVSTSTAKLSGVKIAKAPAKLTAKKLTSKKGKKNFFTVTVKNSKTKKVLSNVKIKIKVYTGKKAKTYTVKTDSKGIAKLNVKKLAAGKHKVVVSIANSYCSAKQVKSTIKIK